jgi:hypothetical protein
MTGIERSFGSWLICYCLSADRQASDVTSEL